MAEINYKKIARSVLGDTRLKLEDLNVALFARILGERNPKGSPTTMPIKVRGMLDVAREFQPTTRVRLRDDAGNEKTQTVRHFRDVETGGQLVANFHPDNVAALMEEDGELMGLLMRLRIKQESLEQLRTTLTSGNYSSAMIHALDKERLRLVSAVKSLRLKVAEDQQNKVISDDVANALDGELGKIETFLDRKTQPDSDNGISGEGKGTSSGTEGSSPAEHNDGGPVSDDTSSGANK